MQMLEKKLFAKYASATSFNKVRETEGNRPCDCANHSQRTTLKFLSSSYAIFCITVRVIQLESIKCRALKFNKINFNCFMNTLALDCVELVKHDAINARQTLLSFHRSELL